MQTVVGLFLSGLFGFLVAWLLRGRQLQQRVTGAESAVAAAQRTCDDLKHSAADLEGRLATLDAERRAADFAHSALVGRLRLELAAARRAKTELLSTLEADVRAAKQTYDQRLAGLAAELKQAQAVAAREQSPNSGAEQPADQAASDSPRVGEQHGPDLPQPEGRPDDLKKIHGVGPKLERDLNGLGIFNYRQIAGLTAENIAWIDRYLKVRGRVERQNWVAQARVLASIQPTGQAESVEREEQT